MEVDILLYYIPIMMTTAEKFNSFWKADLYKKYIAIFIKN